jgi:drug/metabolite transporter (DMT)-like permease
MVRLAEDAGAGPQTAAFWRFVFAAPALLIALGVREARRSAPRPASAAPAYLFLILSGLLFAGDMATWHAGIVRTTAANATLLATLAPVVVAGCAWFLFGERITRGFVVGAILAIAGAAALSGASFSYADPDARVTRLIGDGLSLLTAVWYGTYMLAVKAARTSHSALVVMVWSTLVAIPLMAITTVAFGENFTPVEPIGWLWLIILGVGVHVGGQGGLAYALGKLPAGATSIVVLLQPVVAAAMGWILFGERLGPIELAGAGLVIAGIVVVQRAAAPVTPRRLAKGGPGG